MSKLSVSDFRIGADAEVDLAKYPTKLLGAYRDEADYEVILAEEKAEMSSHQELLVADGSRALLLVFQGMDASGKDGLLKHVMTGLNPQGVLVSSFKRPTPQELKEHYMQRHERQCPAAGTIAIWNRSHYEEVLVVRVHPELLQARGDPPHKFKDKFWKERLHQIRTWEELRASHLDIVKFFLHVSKREQAQRLLERLEDPSKNWKFEAQDMVERKSWKLYRKAYEAALESTSTKRAPWYVIPADDKLSARLLVSKIINHHLSEMNLDFPRPKTSPSERKKLIRQLKTELKR